MNFLKPGIFYPELYNEDSFDLIENTRIKYERYLRKRKRKINKALYELYHDTHSFHDYKVTSINYTLLKSGEYEVSVSLTDYDLENSYKLKFMDVSTLHISKDSEKVSKRNILDLEVIVLCEIGFENRRNYLAFYMSSGFELNLNFSDVIIESSR